MTLIVALDPGATTGIAIFHNHTLIKTDERTDHDTLELIDTLAPALRHLIIEDWRLQPDKARTMIGSPMPTARTIGALQWIAHTHQLPVHLQQPALKQAGYAQASRRGWDLPPTGGHQRDAAIHGWLWLHHHPHPEET